MNYKRISTLMIISVTIITLILSYFAFFKLKFDFNMRNFYPLNNPETAFFYEYTSKFGWDDDYVLIGIETKKEHVFDKSFLDAVDKLGKQIRNYPMVTHVASPTELEVYRFVPYMNVVTNSPLLHLEEPERLTEDSSNVYTKKELIGSLFAPNKKSVALAVRQTANLQYEQCDSLVRHLEALIEPYKEFKKVHFAGKCFGQTTFVNLTKTEIALFIFLSILVNVLFLYLTYRRLWGIWMPLVVVMTTVIWTIGTMMMLGLSLDFISNIIPTVILIIGISNVIHFLTHYLMEIEQGLGKVEAMRATIKKIGTATIFTSLTTIIGFLSLLFSNVLPLVNLGGYASLGLVFAFIVTYTLFPAILFLYTPKSSLNKNSANDYLQNILEPFFNYVMSNKKAVLVVFGLLLAFGIWGSLKLVVNQHLLEDISESHPQIQSSRFFENDFSGARQFEMQVTFKDKSLDFYNPEALKKLEKVESYLLNTYGAGALFSPVAMFKEANRVLHSGQNTYFKLPETESEFKKAKNLVEKYLYKNYPKVLTNDLKTGRFSGKMGDLGSHEILKRNNLMAEYFKKEGLDKEIEWHITGSAHLMELNNFNIAENVYYGIIFSCLLIAAIIGFMLGSFKMAIVGIIVNALPILFVGGIMGLTGVNIKISTSILFIISFGIAVDDTIHFMSSYRFDRKKYPNDTMKALLETYKSTGKSIIVTSLILCGGFFTLVFSSFGGTFHIGLFTGICLIVALLCDIMLLPVLLYYLRDKSKDPGESN